MPDYKTHSIHSEIVFEEDINCPSEIDRELLKTFAIGTDAMILTDYSLFQYQHSNNTREFFLTLLKYIKDNKLQDNKQVMSFLYGQLDHFVLDVVLHPLIYYMTENAPKDSLIQPHTLVEMWIADYVMQKYDKQQRHYYKSILINNKELLLLIRELYKTVYNKDHADQKYRYGILLITIFDNLIRSNDDRLLKFICQKMKIGDFFYDSDIKRVIPYLNLDHDRIQNPITGEEYSYSFDDLWNKSLEISRELINDVNNYLFLDVPIKNPLLVGNISYNTGLACSEHENFQFVKKYS